MIKNGYFEVASIVALVLAGALCLTWGNSPDQSYTELPAPSQIDTALSE